MGEGEERRKGREGEGGWEADGGEEGGGKRVCANLGGQPAGGRDCRAPHPIPAPPVHLLSVSPPHPLPSPSLFSPLAEAVIMVAVVAIMVAVVVVALTC